jgi:hypothetical protein
MVRCRATFGTIRFRGFGPRPCVYSWLLVSKRITILIFSSTYVPRRHQIRDLIRSWETTAPLSDNRTADEPHFADSAITMPARYAPLPTQRPSEHSDDELDAAFDGSDDELDYDDDNAPVSESQPLNPSRSGRTSPPLSTRNHLPPIAIPGAYDFERVDYDVPPPGSPTRAMANDHGNTNGQIPSFDTDVDFVGNRHGGYRSWFSRAAANVLPSHYIRRLGLGGPSAPTAHVGGGVRNDGVFSNLAAKPERRRLQQTGVWHVVRSTHHLPVQV